MWKIFNCFISILILAIRICHGQQDSGEVKYGLRFGYDISRPILDYLQPNRRDEEFSVDLQVRQNWFAIAEGGWNNSKINNSPKLVYHSSGYFWRIGFDYNLLKHDNINDNNLIYGGFRLGHANLSHSASSFQIADIYWGNVNGSIPLHDVAATWFEIAAGIKIEALKNFFIGWSVRERILLNSNINSQLTPYVIPGFGKGNSKSAFDVNYSLYYRIPFLRIKLKTKKTSSPIK